MPFTSEDTEVYRHDVRAQGNLLSVAEREALLRKYLPATIPQQSRTLKTPRSDRTAGHKPRIRPYLKSIIHLTVYFWIQFVFGVYIRLRQMTSATVHKFLSISHYHHRTPAYIKKDTQALSRLPEHLSILLRYDASSDDGAALEALIDEVAELTAWSAAAGIPLLSIYEKTGVLKSYISAVQELVHQKLVQYFGSAPLTPTLRVYAPNLPPLSPIPTTLEAYAANGRLNKAPAPPQSRIDLLLLSSTDGRDTLVDLTRTLTEMSQTGKLRPKDITSSLINTEINATTSLPTFESPFNSPPLDAQSLKIQPNGSDKHSNGLKDSRLEKTTDDAAPSEPDLLIIFAPYVVLDGYPPWQIRLTEIFCVGDSGGDVGGLGRGRGGRTRVEYQGFLRGLWKYAGAEMRFGR